MGTIIRTKDSERGSVTPIVMGLMMVLLTISLSFFSVIESQSSQTINGGKHQFALNVAEAGIDHIIWRLRQTPDAQNHVGPHWRTISDEQDVTLNGGQYNLVSMDETPDGGIRGFLIEGWVPSRTAPNAVSAQIYAELSPNYMKPWAGAVLGDVAVPVANGNTDSYNGNLGAYGGTNVRYNGDVTTNNPANASINISSQGYIGGNVYYPKTGSPSTVTGPKSNVAGTITTNPANTTFIEIPTPTDSMLQWRYSSFSYVKPVTSNPAVFTLTDSTGTVTGPTLVSPIPPGVYVIKKDGNGDSIKLSGNNELTFSGSTTTVVYLEGNASLSGRGVSNVYTRPANLQFFGMPGCTSIGISGNADFFGVVYAPQASITLNGGGAYGGAYGSLAGRSVEFNGNGTILHYDESLRDVNGVIKGYILYRWTQKK